MLQTLADAISKSSQNLSSAFQTLIKEKTSSEAVTKKKSPFSSYGEIIGNKLEELGEPTAFEAFIDICSILKTYT